MLLMKNLYSQSNPSIVTAGSKFLDLPIKISPQLASLAPLFGSVHQKISSLSHLPFSLSPSLELGRGQLFKPSFMPDLVCLAETISLIQQQFSGLL